jgi:MraZ protein
MFLGEYRQRVNKAGWLCLPGGIQNALHELYAPEDTALILTTFFDWCVFCYPVVEWYKAPEKLRRIGATSLEIRDFFTSAVRCPLDKKKRLYIPQLFREYAEIERDTLLIGMVCYLELWSPNQWERCGGYGPVYSGNVREKGATLHRAPLRRLK